MATTTPGQVVTYVAGEDMTSAQYRPVRMEADGQIDIAGATAGEDALGFLQNNPNTGEAAAVMLDGITKALAGTGGTTAGVAVQAIADGVAAAGSGDYVIGMALDTGAAGEIVRVQILSNHLLA